MNNGNLANVTTADPSSFKYKSRFFKPLIAADNGIFNDGKIDCVMSTTADTKFKITNTKLYAPIVTLSNTM